VGTTSLTRTRFPRRSNRGAEPRMLRPIESHRPSRSKKSEKKGEEKEKGQPVSHDNLLGRGSAQVPVSAGPLSRWHEGPFQRGKKKKKGKGTDVGKRH